MALDVSIPCQTIATLPAGGWTGVLDRSARRHRGEPQRPVRPRQRRRRRRGVPRLGGHRRAPPGRGLRRLQHIAHLGERGRRRRRLHRHTRRHRHALSRKQAADRRRLHRPASGRAAGLVGAHRSRHPLHHLPDGPEAGRDGARRRLRGGVDRGAGRAGPPEPLGPARATGVATILARRALALARRHRRHRHPAAVASDRRHIVRRRLQPDHCAGIG